MLGLLSLLELLLLLGLFSDALDHRELLGEGGKRLTDRIQGWHLGGVDGAGC